MAAYCDAFIATDDELFGIFKGWKRPAPLLEQPITKTAINPFTRQELTIQTRLNPVQPVVDSDAVESGDIRALPSLDCKGISTFEMAQLAEVLMSWPSEFALDEINGRLLIGPKSAWIGVCEFPEVVVERLASLTLATCTGRGTKWAENYRADAATIKNARVRNLVMATPDQDWIYALKELAKLAKRARDESRGMFMRMCP